MADGTEELSAREKDVLRLMASGHTAKSAATALDLSVHTVNDYLREARKKLGVGSSREAARALAEKENVPPQKLVREEIGISGAAQGAQIAAADRPPGDNGRTFAWVITGALMITTVLAIAVAALWHPVDAGGPDAPAAQSVPTADQATERAALDWIALVDAGQYEKSWQNAGKTFRTAVSAATWAAQAEPVRAPLGKVASRKLMTVEAHSHLPGAPEGDYRIIRFQSDFANAKGAVETVVMEREAEGLKVVGYFIK